jgi:hypothetical protein
VGDVLRETLRNAEGTLYLGTQTCSECHDFEEPRTQEPSEWRIKPTNVPEIWFPHASFSHSAHRAVDCDQCHGEARSSTSSDDVLMPSISDCRTCHAPAETHRGALVRGGARFDCVECHRYHHGVSPLQGIGALARQVDAEQRRTVEEFLRGSTAADSGSSPTRPESE